MDQDRPPTEKKIVKNFVRGVNRRDSNYGQVPYTTALKFLRARKYNVDRAVELFIAHERMREEEGISKISPQRDEIIMELLTEKFTVLPGRDKDGAVVALFTLRNHNPKKTTHKDTLKGVVLQLDVAMETIEAQKNGLVFIFDMTNSRFSHYDHGLCTKVLSMLKGAYPARLKKVLIVSPPFWFRGPFKVLRMFLKEKLQERVHTLDANELVDHIPRRVLPRRLGGNARLNHLMWLDQCDMVWIEQGLYNIPSHAS